MFQFQILPISYAVYPHGTHVIHFLFYVYPLHLHMSHVNSLLHSLLHFLLHSLLHSLLHFLLHSLLHFLLHFLLHSLLHFLLHFLLYFLFYTYQVTGPSPLRPCVSFGYFGFDEYLMAAIRKSEFTQPTPIQAQVSCSYNVTHYRYSYGGLVNFIHTYTNSVLVYCLYFV